MKLTVISLLFAIAALTAACSEIPFDGDHYKIISFADPSFRERITPYFDANGDGYVSIHEAENGRMVPYGESGYIKVVMDCDNIDGDHTVITSVNELRYFKNVEVLRFGGNDISGTLDLRMLKQLDEIYFTGNGGIQKIILNNSVRETIVIEVDGGTEIEYYTDPEDEPEI